jgi:hypothetical protein
MSSNSEYNCHCHRQMGNDFYFMPRDACLYVKCNAKADLIAFAKTGAPPALEPEPKDCVEFCGQDECSCDLAWVDKSPTYSAVLAARDSEAERRVPRMQDQKPYHERVIVCSTHGSYTGSPGRLDCPHCDKSLCSECCPDLPVGFKMAVELPKAARPESLNDFAREFHASNQRWWRDLVTGEKLDRNMGEMLMLVVSEIAECMEGERKNLMDDHLPHRKMAEVELADAVIRIADIAGAKGYSLEANSPSIYSRDLPDNKGQALLRISRCVTRVTDTMSERARSQRLSRAVSLIEQYARKHSYDLWGAVHEKREYNKHRADHKPEARLAANGKKF